MIPIDCCCEKSQFCQSQEQISISKSILLLKSRLLDSHKRIISGFDKLAVALEEKNEKSQQISVMNLQIQLMTMFGILHDDESLFCEVKNDLEFIKKDFIIECINVPEGLKRDNIGQPTILGILMAKYSDFLTNFTLPEIFSRGKPIKMDAKTVNNAVAAYNFGIFKENEREENAKTIDEPEKLSMLQSKKESNPIFSSEGGAYMTNYKLKPEFSKYIELQKSEEKKK